jgi:hypothetical protein
MQDNGSSNHAENPSDLTTTIGPAEINGMHDAIMSRARISLGQAIEIGGALNA